MDAVLSVIGFMVVIGLLIAGTAGAILAFVLAFLWCWGAAEYAGGQIADAVRAAMRP